MDHIIHILLLAVKGAAFIFCFLGVLYIVIAVAVWPILLIHNVFVFIQNG